MRHSMLGVIAQAGLTAQYWAVSTNGAQGSAVGAELHACRAFDNEDTAAPVQEAVELQCRAPSIGKLFRYAC